MKRLVLVCLFLLSLLTVQGQRLTYEYGYDNAGNLVTVDTRNLAPGTYVYQIVTDNNVHASGKFVKE